MRALPLLLVAVAACDDPVAIPDTCNGAVALCERRFDEVAYPTTHNAMSSEEEDWVNPNQDFAMARQLDDGIRGLMLDVHEHEDQTMLCHGICLLGMTPLVDGLTTIHDFLDANRGEVVTIIFESYVHADAIAVDLEASGLDGHVHAQAPGQPWPTLRELIDADTRLVLLTDDDSDGAYPWYMDVWAHAWETHYSAQTVDDFSCDMNRGVAGNPLFIFNHFLTDTFPVPEEAANTNGAPFLLDRARACSDAAGGALPNFVTVDFYDIGSVFETTRALNGL